MIQLFVASCLCIFSSTAIYGSSFRQDTTSNNKNIEALSTLLDTAVVVADTTFNSILDTTEIDYSIVAIDSLASADSLDMPDTILVSGGIMPTVKERALESIFFATEDSVEVKDVKVVRPFSELAQQRNPIFKDTIPVQRLTLYSMALPGFGQLYNNQKWKIPIVYGTIGGFVGGTLAFANKFKDAEVLFLDAQAAGATSEELTTLRNDMNGYKSKKTLMIAGAAASYMYFLADNIINYKGDIHPTRKATLLSALFPGAGQLYNKKYWKLPIVYGGLGTFIYVYTFNNRGYQRYKTAHQLLTDGDDSTVDEFNGYYSESALKNTRDSYRRYKDLGIFMIAGFYILQIIDAHVDAYLARYDISDDLTINIEPTVFDAPRVSGGSGYGGENAFGLGMKIKF